MSTQQQAPRIVKVTPVGEGDAAFYWYNAVMETNREKRFYNRLQNAVYDYVPNVEEQITLMNAAIDAAMFICGYDKRLHYTLIGAVMLFESVSHQLAAMLDDYLMEFVRWGEYKS